MSSSETAGLPSSPSPSSGDDALRVVEYLKESLPTVETFFLAPIKPTRGLQERLPNWSSVVEAADGPSSERRYEEVLDQILRHDTARETAGIETVPAAEVSDVNLRRWVEKLRRQDMALALYSHCKAADGSRRYLPLMDFQSEPSPQCLSFLRAALLRLGQDHGVLLESGRSYHFYGVQLLTEAGWLEFMARCLLLSPLTDSRYIGHRLLTGSAALRLSSCSSKPRVPRVVASW